MRRWNIYSCFRHFRQINVLPCHQKEIDIIYICLYKFVSVCTVHISNGVKLYRFRKKWNDLMMSFYMDDDSKWQCKNKNVKKQWNRIYNAFRHTLRVFMQFDAYMQTHRHSNIKTIAIESQSSGVNNCQNYCEYNTLCNTLQYGYTVNDEHLELFIHKIILQRAFYLHTYTQTHTIYTCTQIRNKNNALDLNNSLFPIFFVSRIFRNGSNEWKRWEKENEWWSIINANFFL